MTHQRNKIRQQHLRKIEDMIP